MEILNNKNVIIYGAGGSLGGAIAKAMAAAGANLFVTGRNLAPVQAVADEILQSGGRAEASEVDAMNEDEVGNHLQMVLQKTGSVDVSFNAVGVDIVMNSPLLELSLDDFVRPITQLMQTHFITATAAAKAMKKQNAGVILTLTATPGGIGYPYNGGFAPACCAIENLSKNLAIELGIHGIRVVNMRSGGSPDSRVFKEAIKRQPEVMAPILKQMEADTMLKKLPLMKDIAHLAVFLSSGLAANITGVTVDITGGTTSGLNYRVAPVAN